MADGSPVRAKQAGAVQLGSYQSPSKTPDRHQAPSLPALKDNTKQSRSCKKSPATSWRLCELFLASSGPRSCQREHPGTVGDPSTVHGPTERVGTAPRRACSASERCYLLPLFTAQVTLRTRRRQVTLLEGLSTRRRSPVQAGCLFCLAHCSPCRIFQPPSSVLIFLKSAKARQVVVSTAFCRSNLKEIS